MGMKTIQAKKLELAKKCDTLYEFTLVAEDLNKGLHKIEAAFKEIDAVRAELAGKLKSLETFGIKEFIVYKDSLEWIAFGSSQSLIDLSKKMTRPMPVDPLKKVVQQQQGEVDKMMSAWMEKHTATFPKEIKPGMCFKYKDGSVVEILAPGDQHASYKVKRLKDGKESVTQILGLSVTLGYKYLQTA